MAEETSKKMFQNVFLPSADDIALLRALEKGLKPIVSSLLKNGYDKNAVADGVIAAINIWRNK